MPRIRRALVNIAALAIFGLPVCAVAFAGERPAKRERSVQRDDAATENEPQIDTRFDRTTRDAASRYQDQDAPAPPKRTARQTRERGFDEDRNPRAVEPATYVADAPAAAHAEHGSRDGFTADGPAQSLPATSTGPAVAEGSRGKALPLATKRLPNLGEGAKTEQSGGWSALVSVGGSLTIVMGLFLVVVWFLRRTNQKATATLPTDVFEVLGRAPLAGRQTAQLVRCGGKLLLLSVTPGGSETLTEITDPAEVDRLAGLCQQTRGTSASTTFRNLFSQFGSDPVQPASAKAASGKGLFARRETRFAATGVSDDFAADRALATTRREGRDV